MDYKQICRYLLLSFWTIITITITIIIDYYFDEDLKTYVTFYGRIFILISINLLILLIWVFIFRMIYDYTQPSEIQQKSDIHLHDTRRVIV